MNSEIKESCTTREIRLSCCYFSAASRCAGGGFPLVDKSREDGNGLVVFVGCHRFGLDLFDGDAGPFLRSVQRHDVVASSVEAAGGVGLEGVVAVGVVWHVF